MALPVRIPLERTWDGRYGLEVVEQSEGRVRGRTTVDDGLKQPMGLVHGGVYASMAEGLASMATWQAVSADGKVAMGISNHTSFLRPITHGHIHAEARARQRGRTTWVWDVDFTDDDGRLCALTRVTIAVRQPRDSPPSS